MADDATTATRQLVEVDDGIRLMLHRRGTGSPPVVCLSCAGGAHDEWAEATVRLVDRAQVLTYGRPALGGSDPLPAPLAGHFQSIGWAAAQLHTLLQAAGIDPPYVLLSSSIGAWIADQYTARWPDEVAGLVLVDPTTLSPWPKLPLAPIVDGPDDEPGCIRFDEEASYAELAHSVPPPPPRYVVVSASVGWRERRPPRSRWWEPLTLAEVDQFCQNAQRAWVDRLAARDVVADTAGHFVHRDQPALVAHVVRAVVDSFRRGESLELSAATVAAADGRLRPARS